MRPQRAPSMIGKVLGSYRVIGELGAGGMGRVYRAEHALLGRPAAIKILHPEMATNDELMERFFNEAKAATAIRHPGIVEVYDFGYTEDGQAYLAMELLEGEPLDKRLARVTRLGEAEATRLVRGIASALKAAHARGIVHRDLKPDNIFVVPDPEGGERIKILDFGVAKLAARSPEGPRHTQTGALMGTPRYMAPEQARAAGAIDHRADLYSLGCILYELLVGRPPFVAEGGGEIIAMHMFEPPEPPRQLQPGISPAIEAVVLRLLEKEPHARYQTVAELQQALVTLGPRGRALEATPIPGTSGALRLGGIDRRTQPEARRSTPAVFAALVAVVVAGAIGIYLLQRGGGDRPTPPPVAPTPTASPASAPPPAPAVAPPPSAASPPAGEIVVVDSGDVKSAIKRRTPPAARAGSAATTGAYSKDGSPIELDLGDTPRPKQPPKEP